MSIFDLFEDEDDTVRETYKRTPLNYIGTKRATLDFIMPLLPYDKVWVDVFGGSGIVTISRRPSKLDVFNDISSGVTAFFLALRDNPDELLGQIELMPHSKEMFIEAKRTFLDEKNTIKRGAKWYYIVQTSFGGRAAHWGRSTHSPNQTIKKYYNNLELFPIVHKRFKEVQIENLDWEHIFDDYDGYDAVFYCDPPYMGSNKYRNQMSEHEHTQLCNRIFDSKCFVALSGFDNSIYNSYDWDGKHVFDVPQRLATNKSIDLKVRNKTRLECLWIKEAG